MDEIIDIHISVTRDDIDNGLRKQAESCPLTLAVGHALQKQGIDFDRIEVDGDIKIYINGERYSWSYGKSEYDEINTFIHAFDREEYVAPFELDTRFELCYEESSDYEE